MSSPRANRYNLFSICLFKLLSDYNWRSSHPPPLCLFGTDLLLQHDFSTISLFPLPYIYHYLLVAVLSSSQLFSVFFNPLCTKVTQKNTSRYFSPVVVQFSAIPKCPVHEAPIFLATLLSPIFPEKPLLSLHF